LLALLAVDDEAADTLYDAFRICLPNDTLFRADTSETCLKLLKEKCPDIVILDTNLKHHDFYETIRQIRNIGNTPILVLSYLNDESQIVSVLDSGANDYMLKPIRQLEAIARIKSLLRQTQVVNNRKDKP
jgi:DNA-binding response OmpR family regulator